MIVIVDYGMGNLGSIKNMLKKIGRESIISNKPADINRAEKLILPGVGAFGSGMKNLETMGLIDLLSERVLKQETPVLGICLGMQLLAGKSEEAPVPGLGWIDAEIKRFKFNSTQSKLKIPHMGWNTIEIKKESDLIKDLYTENRFYFVHSYHMVSTKKEIILAETHYGYNFISCVVDRNIMGVQFHPEKSHRFGMTLLSNFARLF